MDNFIFPNLKAELARANISKPALAEIVGISSGAMYAKTSGKTEFTRKEMILIRDNLEKINDLDLSLDYLFDIGD